ncbi:MAG: discoidin domain-containing protein [Firmicutes bacterium]|nr:discoidin domain-containing protein [Bacillota bacterium]
MPNTYEPNLKNPAKHVDYLAREAFRRYTEPLEVVLLSNVASAIGPSEAVDLQGRTRFAVQATGTFSAQIKIEASLDGESWVEQGAALTAAGFQSLTLAAKFVRVNVSGYTSGTIEKVLLYAVP